MVAAVIELRVVRPPESPRTAFRGILFPSGRWLHLHARNCLQNATVRILRASGWDDLILWGGGIFCGGPQLDHQETTILSKIKPS